MICLRIRASHGVNISASLLLLAICLHKLWQAGSGLEALLLLQNLVSSIVENAQQPVFQLDFVDSAEREKVLMTFNATERALPPPYDNVTIHGLFEHWAKETPAARAISFEVGAQVTLAQHFHVKIL